MQDTIGLYVDIILSVEKRLTSKENEVFKQLFFKGKQISDNLRKIILNKIEKERYS